MSRRPTLKSFVVGGLVVAVALVVVVGPLASRSPDGLEKVAIDNGFIGRAEDHALTDSPFADYVLTGLDVEGLSSAVAGVLGVLVAFGAGLAAFGALRAWRKRVAASDDEGP